MIAHRRPLIVGNWKMNKTASEAETLVNDLLDKLGARFVGVDVAICPPFTAIPRCVKVLSSHSTIMLGAQNVHHESNGAYTGEISASMLRDLFCRYVIVGHSERREHFHETDELVNAKAKAAFLSKINVILCVGEKLNEREENKTKDVIGKQLRGCLADLAEENWSQTVVAYEPVWAIGTGKVATPEQAQDVHEFIRQQVAKMAGESVAQKIRILYGGSVKPDNAADLFKQPDIDGALVGGASLEARSFVSIIQSSISYD
ncbi:MAG: triose-phosphate isomerase [bacterium]